jgi:hypothetical protein
VINRAIGKLLRQDQRRLSWLVRGADLLTLLSKQDNGPSWISFDRCGVCGA